MSETIPLTVSLPKELEAWIEKKRAEGFVISRLIVKMIERAIEEEKTK